MANTGAQQLAKATDGMSRPEEKKPTSMKPPEEQSQSLEQGPLQPTNPTKGST
jgi:hypothetical protein